MAVAGGGARRGWDTHEILLKFPHLLKKGGEKAGAAAVLFFVSPRNLDGVTHVIIAHVEQRDTNSNIRGRRGKERDGKSKGGGRGARQEPNGKSRVRFALVLIVVAILYRSFARYPPTPWPSLSLSLSLSHTHTHTHFLCSARSFNFSIKL
jgi:hypothetical protein